jgi:uncharacterized protein with GYD domain
MALYVTLVNFTEKGLNAVKDSVKRSEAFKNMAKEHGATVKEIIWTQGAYDVVTVIEAPDDETASAVMLSVSKLGNVRGQTLRGFGAAEMQRILDKVG